MLSGRMRVVPGEGEARLGPTRTRTWRGRALVAGAGLLAAVTVAWNAAAGRRAMKAVPPAQRWALVARGVDELERFCGDARPVALEDHCRDVASVLSQLDECTGACAALVRAQLAAAPTR